MSGPDAPSSVSHALGALVWLVLLAGVLAIFIRAGRRWRREAVQKESTERERREAATSAGEMTHDGQWLCVVCRGALAKLPWPTITTHWVDRMPVVSHWLHRLYSLTPRYGIEAPGDEKHLCPAHARLVRSRLEQKLSDVRSRTAAFNAGIEEELARVESGELIEWARLEHRRSSENLRAKIERADRLLPVAAANQATDTPLPGAVGTVTITPSTGGGGGGDDDGDAA